MASSVMAAAAALSVALMAAVATAQMPDNCMDVLISMSPCLDYIIGNSTTPEKGCCTQLASVVESQPKCLCEVISGDAAASLGININETLALELPAACNVKTPSASRCKDAAAPGGSPPAPSTPPPPGSPGGNSPPPSGKSTPSGDTANGYAIKAGIALFVTLFLFPGSAWDI